MVAGSTPKVVVINADAGEAFGAWGDAAAEERLVPLVGAVNVACGFHAGDPVVIARTVELAARGGASVGAHPGYPDLQGFGRRDMAMEPGEIEASVLYQIGAVAAFARAAGTALSHVKPHGALYHRVMRDLLAARAIARAISLFDPGLILVAMPRTALARAGEEAGLSVAGEAFPDRAYRADGTLSPRGLPGAVVGDPAEVARRALRMVEDHVVEAIDGTPVPIQADTLCIHGDTPRSADLARAVRDALSARSVRAVTFGEWRSLR